MDKWVECIETVSSSIGKIDNSIESVVKQFLSLAEENKIDITQAQFTTQTLIHRIDGSSNALINCLSDLATMSKAMKDTIDANPDIAHGLIFNFFNTFLRQLSVYYKETYESFQQAELEFRQGKSSSSNSRNNAISINNNNNNNESNVTFTPAKDSSNMNEVTKKKTGEGKKKKKINSIKDDNLISQEIQEVYKEEKNQKELDLIESTSTPSVISPVNFINNSKGIKEPKIKQKEHHELIEKSVEKLSNIIEPEYLHVTSTIEESLGRIVLSNRPNVFTAPETIERKATIATYYISLPNPGCLGKFLFKNFIALEEDMQADLMCDILQTDCVEVEPFVSPSGEINIENLEDLRELPACGWRIGASEDRQQLLYTMYILVNRGTNIALSKSLFIQESLVIGSEREEVLQIITPILEAPQFAKVTVHGFNPLNGRNASPTRKYNSDRLSAILSITKGIYEKNGFIEVREDEVNSSIQQHQHQHQHNTSQLLLRGEEQLFTKAKNNTATFQGTVELASLSEPSEQQSWGFSDVAKGAVRGAAAVVLAPVSVGKVVGNAMLDVSGVSGAIKQQTEGLFRKSFPNLISEEIIESFNCALVEDGNPLPKQGFLFITPHWLCFQASLLNANFSLEWDEIRDVQKQRSVKVLENAIAISTHLGGSYFLTSFVQRDQAYNIIMKQWLRR